MNTRFNQLFQLPDWLPTPGNRRLKRAVHNLDQLIQGFIDARRNTGEDKGDLLSMLLLAREADGSGGMTDKQVRDEAMTLFGAGHETTANALMWTWYLLAQHPHIEAKLHAELDAALDGRAPTLADLPNLPYTERVVKEAMRLYPPAWAFTREAVQPFDLNGFPVHPRDVLLVNVYGLHHSAQYFPQPETFDPDRWTPAFEKALPRYAYIPFGGGPRVCIGNAFAMMEARLVLAAIAQRFALRLVPGYPVVPRRVFTLRAAHGIAMQVQVRTAAHTPVVEAAAPMPT
jgi:cytochrome P450